MLSFQEISMANDFLIMPNKKRWNALLGAIQHNILIVVEPSTCFPLYFTSVDAIFPIESNEHNVNYSTIASANP